MDEIQFSAADIRVFLAEHLPYYEAEDKDDFLYIAKASDIERVALQLYHHLTSKSSRPDDACPKCATTMIKYRDIGWECPACQFVS